MRSNKSTRVNNTKRRVNNTKRRVNNTNRKVNYTKRRVNNTNRKVNYTKRRVNNTKRRVNNTKRRVNNTKRRVNNTKRRVNNTKRRVYNTKRRVNNTKRRVNNTKRRVNKYNHKIGGAGGAGINKIEVNSRVVELMLNYHGINIEEFKTIANDLNQKCIGLDVNGIANAIYEQCQSLNIKHLPPKSIITRLVVKLIYKLNPSNIQEFVNNIISMPAKMMPAEMMSKKLRGGVWNREEVEEELIRKGWYGISLKNQVFYEWCRSKSMFSKDEQGFLYKRDWTRSPERPVSRALPLPSATWRDNEILFMFEGVITIAFFVILHIFFIIYELPIYLGKGVASIFKGIFKILGKLIGRPSSNPSTEVDTEDELGARRPRSTSGETGALILNVSAQPVQQHSVAQLPVALGRAHRNSDPEMPMLSPVENDHREGDSSTPVHDVPVIEGTLVSDSRRIAWMG